MRFLFFADGQRGELANFLFGIKSDIKERGLLSAQPLEFAAVFASPVLAWNSAVH